MMAFFLLMWLLGSTANGDLKGIAESIINTECAMRRRVPPQLADEELREARVINSRQELVRHEEMPMLLTMRMGSLPSARVTKRSSR